MLHYFLLILMGISYIYSVYSNRRFLTLLFEIRANQREQYKNLDERITSLRDHVRGTEKSVYKFINEQSHHGEYHSTDPATKEKLEALQREIEHLNSLLLKMVTLIENPQPKKKAKND